MPPWSTPETCPFEVEATDAPLPGQVELDGMPAPVIRRAGNETLDLFTEEG